MNRDLNIKSTIRQILGVLISIMILMPFTVSSQTVTTTIDCANATTTATDIVGTSATRYWLLTE